jgi:hypothetical protein
LQAMSSSTRIEAGSVIGLTRKQDKTFGAHIIGNVWPLLVRR